MVTTFGNVRLSLNFVGLINICFGQYATYSNFPRTPYVRYTYPFRQQLYYYPRNQQIVPTYYKTRNIPNSFYVYGKGNNNLGLQNTATLQQLDNAAKFKLVQLLSNNKYKKPNEKANYYNKELNLKKKYNGSSFKNLKDKFGEKDFISIKSSYQSDEDQSDNSYSVEDNEYNSYNNQAVVNVKLLTTNDNTKHSNKKQIKENDKHKVNYKSKEKEIKEVAMIIPKNNKLHEVVNKIVKIVNKTKAEDKVMENKYLSMNKIEKSDIVSFSDSDDVYYEELNTNTDDPKESASAFLITDFDGRLIMAMQSFIIFLNSSNVNKGYIENEEINNYLINNWQVNSSITTMVNYILEQELIDSRIKNLVILPMDVKEPIFFKYLLSRLYDIAQKAEPNMEDLYFINWTIYFYDAVQQTKNENPYTTAKPYIKDTAQPPFKSISERKQSTILDISDDSYKIHVNKYDDLVVFPISPNEYLKKETDVPNENYFRTLFQDELEEEAINLNINESRSNKTLAVKKQSVRSVSPTMPVDIASEAQDRKNFSISETKTELIEDLPEDHASSTTESQSSNTNKTFNYLRASSVKGQDDYPENISFVEQLLPEEYASKDLSPQHSNTDDTYAYIRSSIDGRQADFSGNVFHDEEVFLEHNSTSAIEDELSNTEATFKVSDIVQVKSLENVSHTEEYSSINIRIQPTNIAETSNYFRASPNKEPVDSSENYKILGESNIEIDHHRIDDFDTSNQYHSIADKSTISPIIKTNLSDMKPQLEEYVKVCLNIKISEIQNLIRMSIKDLFYREFLGINEEKDILKQIIGNSILHKDLSDFNDDSQLTDLNKYKATEPTQLYVIAKPINYAYQLSRVDKIKSKDYYYYLFYLNKYQDTEPTLQPIPVNDSGKQSDVDKLKSKDYYYNPFYLDKNKATLPSQQYKIVKPVYDDSHLLDVDNLKSKTYNYYPIYWDKYKGTESTQEYKISKPVNDGLQLPDENKPKPKYYYYPFYLNRNKGTELSEQYENAKLIDDSQLSDEDNPKSNPYNFYPFYKSNKKTIFYPIKETSYDETENYGVNPATLTYFQQPYFFGYNAGDNHSPYIYYPKTISNQKTNGGMELLFLLAHYNKHISGIQEDNTIEDDLKKTSFNKNTQHLISSNDEEYKPYEYLKKLSDLLQNRPNHKSYPNENISKHNHVGTQDDIIRRKNQTHDNHFTKHYLPYNPGSKNYDFNHFKVFPASESKFSESNKNPLVSSEEVTKDENNELSDLYNFSNLYSDELDRQPCGNLINSTFHYICHQQQHLKKRIKNAGRSKKNQNTKEQRKVSEVQDNKNLQYYDINKDVESSDVDNQAVSENINKKLKFINDEQRLNNERIVMEGLPNVNQGSKIFMSPNKITKEDILYPYIELLKSQDFIDDQYSYPYEEILTFDKHRKVKNKYIDNDLSLLYSDTENADKLLEWHPKTIDLIDDDISFEVNNTQNDDLLVKEIIAETQDLKPYQNIIFDNPNVVKNKNANVDDDIFLQYGVVEEAGKIPQIRHKTIDVIDAQVLFKTNNNQNDKVPQIEVVTYSHSSNPYKETSFDKSRIVKIENGNISDIENADNLTIDVIDDGVSFEINNDQNNDLLINEIITEAQNIKPFENINTSDNPLQYDEVDGRDKISQWHHETIDVISDELVLEPNKNQNDKLPQIEVLKDSQRSKPYKEISFDKPHLVENENKKKNDGLSLLYSDINNADKLTEGHHKTKDIIDDDVYFEINNDQNNDLLIQEIFTEAQNLKPFENITTSDNPLQYDEVDEADKISHFIKENSYDKIKDTSDGRYLINDELVNPTQVLPEYSELIITDDTFMRSDGLFEDNIHETSNIDSRLINSNNNIKNTTGILLQENMYHSKKVIPDNSKVIIVDDKFTYPYDALTEGHHKNIEGNGDIIESEGEIFAMNEKNNSDDNGDERIQKANINIYNDQKEYYLNDSSYFTQLKPERNKTIYTDKKITELAGAIVDDLHKSVEDNGKLIDSDEHILTIFDTDKVFNDINPKNATKIILDSVVNQNNSNSNGNVYPAIANSQYREKMHKDDHDNNYHGILTDNFTDKKTIQLDDNVKSLKDEIITEYNAKKINNAKTTKHKMEANLNSGQNSYLVNNKVHNTQFLYPRHSELLLTDDEFITSQGDIVEDIHETNKENGETHTSSEGETIESEEEIIHSPEELYDAKGSIDIPEDYKREETYSPKNTNVTVMSTQLRRFLAKFHDCFGFYPDSYYNGDVIGFNFDKHNLLKDSLDG